MTHPIDDNSSEPVDFLAVVNNGPPDGLKIVTGWRKPGNVDEFGKNLALNRLFLVSSNGSAGAQEVLHLFGVEEPIVFDGWALLWGHASVRHGPMRADGHTMAAVDTKLLSIFSGGWYGFLVLYFNDSYGALSDTQTVLFAFVLICNK